MTLDCCWLPTAFDSVVPGLCLLHHLSGSVYCIIYPMSVESFHQQQWLKCQVSLLQIFTALLRFVASSGWHSNDCMVLYVSPPPAWSWFDGLPHVLSVSLLLHSPPLTTNLQKHHHDNSKLCVEWRFIWFTVSFSSTIKPMPKKSWRQVDSVHTCTMWILQHQPHDVYSVDSMILPLTFAVKKASWSLSNLNRCTNLQQ